MLTSSRTTCAALGLPTSLAAMRVKAMRVRARWVVYVYAAKEDAEAARDWVESLGPRAFHVSRSGIIRAELDEIPFELGEVIKDQRFADLGVGADSTVVLDRHETNPQARDAARSQGSRDPRRIVDVALTERQGLALARAVQAGYYDLPRQTDLQWLADSLGVSTSSLSELLRRAEGRLVRAYLMDHPAGILPPSEKGVLPMPPPRVGASGGPC